MMTKGKTLNKINEFIVLLIIRLSESWLIVDFFLSFFFPEASSMTKLNVFTERAATEDGVEVLGARGDLVLPGMLVWLLLFTDM